jgi:hypothetical protein
MPRYLGVEARYLTAVTDLFSKCALHSISAGYERLKKAPIRGRTWSVLGKRVGRRNIRHMSPPDSPASRCPNIICKLHWPLEILCRLVDVIVQHAAAAGRPGIPLL